MLWLVLLLFLATVQGQFTNIPKMDEHRCLASAWVADGNRFRYAWLRKSSPIPFKPRKILIDGEYPWLYTTSFRKGQTLHILAELTVGNYAGNFEFNVLGGAPVIKDNSGADVLHLKFYKARNILPQIGQSGRSDGRRPTGSLSVVANTRRGGEWMSEVKKVGPFYGDNELPMTITAMEDKFEIRTFGEVFIEYPYRLSLDHINFINALGELNLKLLYLGGQLMKAPLRVLFPVGGIKPGFNLIFLAIPSNENFSIAFTDPEVELGIMFEMKVNFDQSTVILNSKIWKDWGQEVRASHFPFKAGKAFEMEIRFFEKTLTVYVDTKELATFDHRAKPVYGEMSFYGSLEIRTLTICEPPRSVSRYTEDIKIYTGEISNRVWSYQRWKDP
uniref:Galectin n=2 Tax=Panagrellus redivivus TaxID=6233 RepID=A0A7E4ZYU2_PANRE